MKKVLLGLPIVVVLLIVALMATPFIATCGGADEAVTEVVQRCDKAVKFLGSDAHPARMGFACGSTEISGPSGTSSWSLPFTGENGRGTVYYQAIKENGEWNVVGAMLEAGDETIDLVACAGGAASSLQKLDGTFDGKVTSSTHEQIKTDMVCTGTIKRAAGETLAEVDVTCADTADAGEGTVVYRGRSEVRADMGSSEKGDETLRVWSQSPAWEIVVSL